MDAEFSFLDAINSEAASAKLQQALLELRDAAALASPEQVAAGLIHCLHHPESKVRETAWLALDRHIMSIYKGRYGALAPEVLAGLSDPDRNVRYETARLLGDYPLSTLFNSPFEAEITTALLALLQGADWLVRHQAAEALGNSPDRRVTLHLVQLVGDPIPEVRLGAVLGLKIRRDAGAYQAVKKLAENDPDGTVRGAASDALSEIPRD
jgi:HEAT repeat protein